MLVLNLSSVTGELCIRVVVAHQSQPNRPLNTLERQLAFRSCPVASINSVASCSVSVEFSLAESSGQVPHGTIATFKPLSLGTDRLVGAEYATCFNGVWSDLSQRTSSCKFGDVDVAPLSTDEAVVITFVITMISTLIVGVISSSLVTHCIIKRRASRSERLAGPDQPMQRVLCMNKYHCQRHQSRCLKWETCNVAYGPVRH